MTKISKGFVRCLPMVAFLGLAWSAGCSCAPETGTPDAGPNDAQVPADGGGLDGTTSVDTGVVPMDSVVPGPDGNGFDVGPGGCFPAQCSGHQYLCGNCLDDDMDGLIDSADPDCLNQCDNTEDVYDLGIPGGDTATCMIDCYYDADQGPGNDMCTWNYECDPLGPGVDPAHGNRCDYNPSATCTATQPTACHDVCGPLTPNGCDCFGCCEIEPGSGDYVYLGSTPAAGSAPCSPATLHDPTSCRPCTPVADCLNTCEHCELCFGATTIPADCFPGTDAGTPAVDAAYPDGGHPDAAMPDAGTSVRCPSGNQPCGLPGDPICPAGDYCITGCCQYFG